MNAEADTVEYEKQRWVTAQIIDLIYSRAPLGLALSVVVAGLMVFMLRHDVPAASNSAGSPPSRPSWPAASPYGANTCA